MMKFMTQKDVATGFGQPVEIINARVPTGTMKRIDASLGGGEVRSAFIRVAIEAELKRREKRLAKKP